MQTSAERGLGEASTRRPSDRELIARFLASRDESAFAEIVTRYSRLVMSVALHTLRDPHAAEDAFQAAFLVLARSARRIRNRDSLAPWLHGTTFRVSHRLLRTRLRRKEQDLGSVELPSPIWADPERPDEQAALDEELARLSEGLRGPLVLHYLEGRTVPEIAAELKMSQAAVEGRLKRGKKTLRKRLLRRGVLLSSAVFGAGLTVPAEAGVAGTLVTATVAVCLKTAAATSLTPIAASMVQQIAVQEMAAMTRIALLKTALVCGGVAGAVGLAGAGMNGTLGMAWAHQGEGTVVADGIGSRLEAAELPMEPTGVIQTALTQAPGAAPNVVIRSDGEVLAADRLEVDAGGQTPIAGESGPVVPASAVSDVKVINAEGAIKTPSVRAHVEASLKSPAELRFTGQTLQEALHFIAANYKIPIIAERGAMQSAGIKFENDEVFGLVKGVPLEEALQLVLESVKGRGLKFRVEDDGLHVGPKAAKPARAVAGQSGEGAALAEALLVADRQAAARDQQVRALEEMVEALQAQLRQIRNEAAVEKAGSGSSDASGGGTSKGPGPMPGTFDLNLESAAAALGIVPTGTDAGAGDGGLVTGTPVASQTAETKALQEQVEQMRGIIEAQKAIIEAQKARSKQLSQMSNEGGVMGMGMAIPGMAGGGMAGMMSGAGNAGPQRPKAVDDMLKTADKERAKALREYLTQLEKIVGTGGAWASQRAGGQSNAEIREFRPERPAEDRIRRTLDEMVDFQFTGQSLQEVMNFLAAQNNIVIRLDNTTLTSAGVGPDQEINLVLSGTSLRSALNLMLQDVGGTALDYIIEDDVMKITTKEKADQTMQTVIYDVSGLGTVDANWVASTLEKTVEPQSWESAGGRGTIVTNDSAVMVTTSRRLHDKTAEIMQMLQQHAKAKKPTQ